jgi:hypothetical protein
VDLAGPLSVAADGSTYLLTFSDRNTHLLEAGLLQNTEAITCVEALVSNIHLLEAAPLQNMEAITCVEALVLMWLARYNIPSQITRPRAQAFLGTVLQGRSPTSPLPPTTPKANRIVERTHR